MTTTRKLGILGLFAATITLMAQNPGIQRTIIERKDVSAGKEAVIARVEIAPGASGGRHTHFGEEISYVMEGEITFTVENRTVIGTPGTFVQIPRGTPHAFKNQTAAPARMLIQCSPAGFDSFMAEFATELPSPASPPLPPSPAEIEKLLSVAPKYGIVMLPPPH